MDVSSIWTSQRHTHKTIVERMHALVVICVMYDKSLALYLCTQPSHLVCLHSNDILILIKYFVKKVDWIYKISIPGRASIEYYVGQVMRNNESTETGYVIKVFNNGIVVLVPKFGVEGLIRLDNLTEDPNSAAFDEVEYKLTFVPTNSDKPRDVYVFDKVEVQVRSVMDPITSKRKAELLLK